jgi:nitrogenase molybdenum-iron protein alpha/beta subunit
MKLTVWTYEGPPHVGAIRIATAMKGVHYVLHAPQGDTYADLLFTMIERRDRRPPVTYTTFQARDLGTDTAELFKTAVTDAYERFQPEAMIVGASCTAELIQDDPGGLARSMALPIPVIPLDLPSYQKKENWGASETFYQMVRALAGPATAPRAPREPGAKPSCNILGPTALGFRHRDDVVEITRLLERLGVAVKVTAPMDASPGDLRRLPEADFNVVLYPEIAEAAAGWLERTHGQPAVRTVPIGVGATRDFIAEVARVAGIDATAILAESAGRMPWWSRSVDSNYLTGKRVFIFGDATHAIAAARVASEELGLEVVGLGAYNREFAREVRRLPRGRAGDRGTSARTGARHPDGAPHRQAATHRLRGDLRAGSRPGFPRPLLPADGFRRRERAVRHLGPSPRHGTGGASAGDVPRRLRVQRRGGPVPPRPWRSRHGASGFPSRVGDRLEPGGPGGTLQNPLLRARQGPPQYRAVRDDARPRAHSSRDSV